MDFVSDLLEALTSLNVKLGLDEQDNLIVRGDRDNLTSELIASIKALKSEIIVLLKSHHQQITDIPLSVVKRTERIPLSFSQSRLWLLDQIDGGSAHYNVPGSLKLTGALNSELLNRVFTTILERHESLRTCFVFDQDGSPVQSIQSAVPFILPLTDLSSIESNERCSRLAEISAEEAGRPFNLSFDLMLRAQLIKLAVDEYILLVTMHHIASDGWSMSLLINEFSALYSAYSQGKVNPLLPLSIQYVDYTYWQRQWLQGDVLNKQLNYWKKQLAGLPAVHGLPLDHPRPPMQSFVGNTHYSHIEAVTGNNLNQFCQSQGATLFMGLHAAFSLLLSRYSNEIDIVIGTPIANRESPELANIIGFFVNNLVLRTNISEGMNFFELLSQCKTMLLDAYAHQQVSFDQIVECTQPERSLSYSPLFQIMLVLQNNEEGCFELPGLFVEPVIQARRVAKYDLNLIVKECANGLNLEWEFNTDLFNTNTISHMASHFNTLIKSLLKSPDTDVFSASMLELQEQKILLDIARGDQKESLSLVPRLLHAKVMDQINCNGNRLAIKTSLKILTYSDVGLFSKAIALRLLKNGTFSNKLIAVVMGKGWEQIIAVLGILRAGGAYLPIDANLPTERIASLLDIGGVSHVITTKLYEKYIPEHMELTKIFVEDNYSDSDLEEIYNNEITIEVNADDLAYVIFTSGSTGIPKGVMIDHKGAANTVDDICYRFSIDLNDSVLGLSNLNFDLSVFDIFGLLGVGGKLILPSDDEVNNPHAWNKYLNQESISIWNTVPAFMQILTQENTRKNPNTSLRLILMSGDWIPLELPANIAQHFPCAQQISLGGATEASIWSIHYPIQNVSDTGRKSIPYGRSLSNQQMYVLQKNLAPCPFGVIGEIFIGGIGLSLGYWQAEAITLKSFIVHPISGERLYKTGDLGRVLADGNIEFLGRVDHQIKIRGFRIELGEIENKLIINELVKDAIVLVKESSANDKYLVAYVILNSVGSIESYHGSIGDSYQEFLRHYLGQHLPDYMIPLVFVFIEKIPLTQNGKVDRKALQSLAVELPQTIYVPPETNTEKLLCEIWQDVLGLERVGITDNFFRLGGHSLLVVQIVSRVLQQGISMSAHQLFSAPILSDLAFVLDSSVITFDIPYIVPANIIPLGCHNITPEMLPLTSLTQMEIDRIVQSAYGGPSNIQDIYPLGSLQEGILFHHLMSVGGDPYVLPMLLQLESYQLVTELLEALQFVVNRHDVLRTAVCWSDLITPVQIVYRQVDLPVTWIEIDPYEDELSFMQALCAPELQIMDLNKAPLLRLTIASKKNSSQNFVLLQLHHIISDHMGLEIILRELIAYREGKAASLPLPVAYREFIAHTQYQKHHHDAELFFQKLLGDFDEPTLPFGLLDIHGDGSQIAEFKECVNVDISKRIRSLSKSLQFSPAVIFHAAWALVVGCCSGREDVIFGTVVSGRMQGATGSENMLGVFINTLPFRVKFSESSVAELVFQIQNLLKDLLLYEQASLSVAQRSTNLSGGAPLFSAVLNYRHSALMATGEEIKSDVEIDAGFKFLSVKERTNYPFNLTVDDLGDGFSLDVQVDNSISAERVASYIQSAIARLVEALETVPDTPVKSLSILSDVEREKLLINLNGSAVDYPKEKCIHEFYEVQAEKNPNAIALIFGDKQMTYFELNVKANQLAHYLVSEKKIKPDTLIGICVERSLEMVIGILAILKSGGAYVPLDPNYPEARLTHMMNDAKLVTVLTQYHLRETIPVSDAQAIYLDSENLKQNLLIQSTQNLCKQQLGLNSNNLAYVIYTSGSTGQPKGSLLNHRGLCNLALAQIQGFGVTSESRVLQFASIAFDAATSEIFMALVQGASLILVGNEYVKSPDSLSSIVEQHKVTHATLPPILLSALTMEHWHSVQTLIVAGDKCPAYLAKSWAKDRQFINAYGPSEVTVCSTMGRYTGDQLNIHIGKPIQNIQVYVVSQTNMYSLVPVGVEGELLIGGVGLARGYLNRPDLTIDKFVKNPFYDPQYSASSELLYKTGDLVRWLPDDNLEFLGRVDHQVKIRGFRIELGEIENRLRTHNRVKDTLVISKVSSNDNEKSLVAYVVVDTASLSNTSENLVNSSHELIDSLRKHLITTLPDYMLPSAFVFLEQLPVTSNGKVDRNALPNPDTSLTQASYIAPQTETEKMLCEMWQQLLSLERVGVSDNFFMLGGHSLLLMRLATAIHMAFKIKIPIHILFEKNTIEKLALALSERNLDSEGNVIGRRFVSTVDEDRLQEIEL